MLSFIRKMTEKRSQPRYTVVRAIRFQSKSGITCVGVSKNIGKDSLLLISEERHPVSANEEGEIVIEYKGVTSVFPGKIIRTERYCMDKYCVVVGFVDQETRDFFDPMVVSDTRCGTCGSEENLEKCPKCKGMQTVCAVCLMRDSVCRECRADDYLSTSRNNN